MDVVALAQFGFANCVATLGTATTSEQAELLFRASDEVIYCFDGDRAGRQAAWRALEATLPKLREGRQARFLFLPEGEDPDSMVRRGGAAAFSDLLDQAQALSSFFFDHFTGAVDMETLDGRAKLVELARPHLEKLPEGVFRDMMFERLGTLARHRVGDGQTARTAAPAKPRQSPQPPSQQRTPMRMALAHLVQNPSLAVRVSNMDALEGCDLPGIEIYRELVDFCARSPNMTTAQLLERLHDHPAQSHLNKLATWQLPGDEARMAQEFRDAVTGIELQWTEALIGSMPRIVDMGPEDRKKLLALQQRRQELLATLQGGPE
jgi:DNA primase